MDNTVQFTTEKAQRDYILVCKARESGDERAYADLMRMYREPLYLMLLKMTNNPTDADDLTIETFGKAFCQLNKYQPTNAFSTWLFSIASNNCIDFIRRKRLETVSLSAMSQSASGEVYELSMPSGLPTPEEEVISEERKEKIREVMDRLDPIYRQAVELRFIDELSYEEISERLGLPSGTVKTRIRRGRAAIIELLKQNNIKPR